MLPRYQGLRRHNAVWFTKDTVQIVRHCYGEQVLAEAPPALEENRAYTLEARVEGDLIREERVYWDTVTLMASAGLFPERRAGPLGGGLSPGAEGEAVGRAAR